MAAKSDPATFERVDLGSRMAQKRSSFARLDQQWSLGLHRAFSSAIPRWCFMVLEHSGNGILWLVLAPTLWLFAPLSAEGRLVLANFFLGLWIDIAFVGALKSLFRRPRPEYNISGDFILVVAVDRYSFPSGHAARQAGYFTQSVLIGQHRQSCFSEDSLHDS